MTSEDSFKLLPIGFVKILPIGDNGENNNQISQIIIDEKIVESLEGIDEFSHLFIIYWMHKIHRKKVRKVHPKGRKDMPLLGVFATRTPCRPNPIGLTLVKLLDRKNNILTVQGLDAYDGTPIIDIKPFYTGDMAKKLRIPKWMITLNRIESE